MFLSRKSFVPFKILFELLCVIPFIGSKWKRIQIILFAWTMQVMECGRERTFLLKGKIIVFN